MKRSQLSIGILGLVSMLVIGTSFSTLADNDLDVVDVVNHGATPTGQFGTSRLLRTDEGIAFELFTSQLVAGNPYTFWLFIDESPAEIGGPPGLDRFEIRLNIDGRFADGAGEARFAGFLPTGNLPSPDGGLSVLATDDGSFDDPEEAAILFLVRAHGQTIAGMEFEQTNHVFGGCPLPPDPSDCVTIQEALHEGDDDDDDSDSDSDDD